MVRGGVGAIDEGREEIDGDVFCAVVVIGGSVGEECE
jgi:hypothetical protein